MTSGTPTTSPGRTFTRWCVGILLVGVCLPALAAAGPETNVLTGPLAAPSLPETGPSLLRVLGALSLVLGLFLGGVWLVRNGRFSSFTGGRAARLNVLETRSLGARQALHVVGYGAERFLIGSTPAGISLVSHLAPSSENETDSSPAPASKPSFAQAFAQVLRGQRLGPSNSGGAKP